MCQLFALLKGQIFDGGEFFVDIVQEEKLSMPRIKKKKVINANLLRYATKLITSFATSDWEDCYCSAAERNWQHFIIRLTTALTVLLYTPTGKKGESKAVVNFKVWEINIIS